MHEYLNTAFCSLLFLLLTVSCHDSHERADKWTSDKLPDSLDLSALQAGYEDGEGYTLIIRNRNTEKGAIKITRVPGYPDIIDTLTYIKTGTYKSLKRPATYFISDSEVVMTVFQKIIHPSSNWQGQTPWQETIVTAYRRQDQYLKNLRNSK